MVKTVMADPAVQAVGSFFGGGTGSAVNTARMFISLKPKGWGKNDRRDDAGTVIARLRGKLSKIPGAQLFLYRQPGYPSRRQELESAIINTRCPIKTSTS